MNRSPAARCVLSRRAASFMQEMTRASSTFALAGSPFGHRLLDAGDGAIGGHGLLLRVPHRKKFMLEFVGGHDGGCDLFRLRFALVRGGRLQSGLPGEPVERLAGDRHGLDVAILHGRTRAMRSFAVSQRPSRLSCRSCATRRQNIWTSSSCAVGMLTRKDVSSSWM